MAFCNLLSRMRQKLVMGNDGNWERNFAVDFLRLALEISGQNNSPKRSGRWCNAQLLVNDNAWVDGTSANGARHSYRFNVGRAGCVQTRCDAWRVKREAT